jgi:hypothetical protein
LFENLKKKRKNYHWWPNTEKLTVKSAFSLAVLLSKPPAKVHFQAVSLRKPSVKMSICTGPTLVVLKNTSTNFSTTVNIELLCTSLVTQ